MRLLGMIRKTARKPEVLVAACAAVLIYYSLIALVYQSFFSLTSAGDAAFVQTTAGVMDIAILSNIPVTINGIGLREQLHSLIFTSFGIGKEAAVAASLLVYSQLLILSFAGFILWLRARVSIAGPGEEIPPQDGHAAGRLASH